MEVEFRLNDSGRVRPYRLRMPQVTRIDNSDAAPRIHFIVEWMELREARATDLVKATGADKGTVSRWINDAVIPSERYLLPLAQFLRLEDPASLFRHPDDDWISRFFKDKSEEERKRARSMLEIAFPKRVA